ncbi:MAG TPA: hypothetical protein VMH22_09420 [bacterium]|nr:hypothetical protein [bacterium]
MRTLVLILTSIVVVTLAREPQLVPAVRIPHCNSRTLSNQSPPLVCIPRPTVDPAELVAPLTRMSPEERANGRMFITATAPEAREVEALWNRGDCDAAIAALRQWAERTELRNTYVGFNWRAPIAPSAAGWGANVRVGSRDSAYLVCFQRDNATGNLLIASACRDGANTDLIVDLSTNGGSTWNETHYGFWTGQALIRDLEMTGSAGFEYVAYLHSWVPDSCYCLRLNAATGAYAKMPDSSTGKTILATSRVGDTLDQIAITSSDDQIPGWEIEVVGGTRQHAVEGGFTVDQGANWILYAALDSFYWGGLDYCYNHYDSLVANRYVFLSCLTKHSGTFYPGYAFYAGGWVPVYLIVPMDSLGVTQTTGITAWRDTIALAYSRTAGSGCVVTCLISNDTGNVWAQHLLTDSSVGRENVSICGRLGDGIGVAWRDYGGGLRSIVGCHSGYAGSTWNTPDTINDHKPDWTDKPRVARVAPGVYGVCYITYDPTAYGSIWYNRSDWSGGIAGPNPVQVLPMSLFATPRRGGAKLSFANPVTGRVNLSVFDAMGRRVLRRSELLKAGAQMLNCPVPVSGSYIAVLKTPAAMATAKFSVLR